MREIITLKNRSEMRKIKQLFLLFCLFVIIQIACTDRGRLNPIDPENPVTRGKPLGLGVISKMDTVILSWQAYSLKNLKGYNIYRCDSLDSTLIKLDSTSQYVTAYYDYHLKYDVTYTYYITAITETFESSLSVPVHITPGPTYKWFLESDIGDIVKLTHDTQYQIFRIHYGGYPDRIAVNTVDHTVWLSDRFLNRIYLISNEGKLKQYFEGFNYPIDLDVALLDSSVWILDQSEDALRLVKLNKQGHVLITNVNFKKSSSISVDQRSGHCWVADEAAHIIYKIDPKGYIVRKIEINDIAPKSVAAFFEDGSCWVADSSRVYKLTANSRPEISMPIENFNFVSRLDVDQKSGACWVLDRFSVTKVDLNGQKLFTFKEFYYPHSLSVNSYDGSCIVADSYHNRAVIISNDGQSIKKIPGIHFPWDVVVEY